MMDAIANSPRLILLLIALGTIAALVLAYIVLEFVVGPIQARRDAARIDALITPLGAAHYRFTGHDDQLRVNSERRRRDAEKKRREAAQIVSGQVKPQIYRVVNE